MKKYLIVICSFLYFLGSIHASPESTGQLLLTVAYCPTAFTSAGAVVAIDTQTGDWTVKGTFNWPQAVFGCVALEDPTVTSDPGSGMLYLDFIDEFALLAKLDLVTFKITSVSPSDEFFVGFTNMAYNASASSQLLGLSPTVEPSSSPFCSNGCYNYGSVDPATGLYRNITDIPFKATGDDVATVLLTNTSAPVFYSQASHDLREGSARCAPSDVDNCLIALSEGQLTSSIYTPFDIYAFGYPTAPGASSVMSWLFWESACRQSLNSYLFATLDLSTAQATPIACVPSNLTIDFDEWIAAFSLDNSLFATASGNSEGDPAQLLVFDTKTATPIVNSDLKGLPLRLGAWSNLIFIWSVDFIPLSLY